MQSPIKSERLKQLPEAMRLSLIAARRKRGGSQAELGRQLGIPQMHVSGIETGKIAPRFDTLLDYVRVLDHDLLLIPRALVPAVQALIRDGDDTANGDGDRPLYGGESDDDEA